MFVLQAIATLLGSKRLVALNAPEVRSIPANWFCRLSKFPVCAASIDRP
jgi:hypothetical protein